MVRRCVQKNTGLEFAAKIINTKKLSARGTFIHWYYSAAQKKRYEYHFMKQKWQQMDIAQYKSVALPLSILGINTTR